MSIKKERAAPVRAMFGHLPRHTRFVFDNFPYSATHFKAAMNRCLEREFPKTKTTSFRQPKTAAMAGMCCLSVRAAALQLEVVCTHFLEKSWLRGAGTAQPMFHTSRRRCLRPGPPAHRHAHSRPADVQRCSDRRGAPGLRSCSRQASVVRQPGLHETKFPQKSNTGAPGAWPPLVRA